MTQKEARELALEVWRYHAKYPEVGHNEELPKSIWDKIKNLHNTCPLCELFCNHDVTCPDCPLRSCADGSHYRSWSDMSIAERKKYAQENVDMICAWEPKD